MSSATRVNSESLASAALDYHDRGFTVLPVTAKVVNLKSWRSFQEQRPTSEQIRKWFDPKRGSDGIGVLNGQGVACRDFDKWGSYVEWCESHPALSRELPTSRTGIGAQVWFRCEHARFVSMGDDGELRAGGKHYSVVPPSWHPIGRRYEWIVPLGERLPSIDPADAGLVAPDPVLPVSVVTHPEHQPHSFQSIQPRVQGENRATPDEVDAIIARTLPTGPGQRNKMIFRLAKALIEAGVTDEAAQKKIAKRWWELAQPVIRTKDWLTMRTDFLRAVKSYNPVKADRLNAAIQRAIDQGLPDELLEEYGHGVALLAGLCRELQRDAGAEPFYMASSVASRIVGPGGSPDDRMRGWRALQALEADGYIKIEKKGTRASRLGSTWWWVKSPLTPIVSIN